MREWNLSHSSTFFFFNIGITNGNFRSSFMLNEAQTIDNCNEEEAERKFSQEGSTSVCPMPQLQTIRIHNDRGSHKWKCLVIHASTSRTNRKELDQHGWQRSMGSLSCLLRSVLSAP